MSEMAVVVEARLPRRNGSAEVVQVSLCTNAAVLRREQAAGRFAMPPEMLRALAQVRDVFPGSRVVHMVELGR